NAKVGDVTGFAAKFPAQVLIETAMTGGGHRTGRIVLPQTKNGIPYGDRTCVTAVKETRFTVIQWNFEAWIELYRTLRTHGNADWTFNGRGLPCKEPTLSLAVHEF